MSSCLRTLGGVGGGGGVVSCGLRSLLSGLCIVYSTLPPPPPRPSSRVEFHLRPLHHDEVQGGGGAGGGGGRGYIPTLCS